MVMFLLAFAIGFAMRLIVWPPAPPRLRSVVRLVIPAILVLGMALSVLGLALAWKLPATLRHASAQPRPSADRPVTIRPHAEGQAAQSFHQEGFEALDDRPVDHILAAIRQALGQSPGQPATIPPHLARLEARPATPPSTPARPAAPPHPANPPPPRPPPRPG